MAKIIVVPDPSVIAAAATAPATAFTMAVPLSRRDVLSARRVLLSEFGAYLLRTAARPGTNEALNQGGMAAPFDVLDGLGALIMEDDVIDRDVVESTCRCVVLDNVDIPLIEPDRQPATLLNDGPINLTADVAWHLDTIGVQAARHHDATGRGVLVGVLDTGIDATHPEFADKSIHFAEFNDHGPVPSAPHDAASHGTHVSALIAGRRCGVAPDADLAVACVLTKATPQGNVGSLTQIFRGLNWLVTEEFRPSASQPGVDLLNASFGAPGYNNYLYQVLANARETKGTLLVGAIGNRGTFGAGNDASPANYDITIGVGATDRADEVAGFSDWNQVSQKPNLCAPGVDIWSAVPSGGYAYASGTSMATPLVAGCCALLLQMAPDLCSDASRLAQCLLLLTRAAKLDASPRLGVGTLDLTAIDEVVRTCLQRTSASNSGM